MKDIKLITRILIIFVLLFLTSCDDLLNVLVIPEGDEGNYLVGKISYSDWTGRGGTITLFDMAGSAKICEGKYSMIVNSLACHGKKFHGKLVHDKDETADFNFEMISCMESYGTALDNHGNKYVIYIGISDKLMENKITNLQEIRKESITSFDYKR
jgi:hypothetical protein